MRTRGRADAGPPIFDAPLPHRMRSRSLRSIISTAVLVIATVAAGQSRSTCLFSETFTGTDLPTGWSADPAQVTVVNGGQTTASWIVGDATQAQAGGYFPVPDDPAGNTFAMVNDDAAPCDCDMDSVSLASPLIDLTGLSHPALRYRVFHDGLPANGRAFVEASQDGSTWTLIEAIPARPNSWQERAISLDAFAGSSMHLRFRYSDAGDWGSGLAIDDVCLFDRTAHDVAIEHTWLGDASVNAFNTTARSLGYTFLPIDQQTGALLSFSIRNVGSDTMHVNTAHVVLSLNGNEVSATDPSFDLVLPPLKDTTLAMHVDTDLPDTGTATITATLNTSETDDTPEDNTGSRSYWITGPQHLGHMMGIDTDVPDGSVGTAAQAYSAGCRFETVASVAEVTGISVRFAGGTVPGAAVTALLTDGALNVLATSESHTITQGDIDLSYNGGLVYLPLTEPLALDQDRDLLALVQAGADTPAVRIATAGIVPLGSAWQVLTAGSTIHYPLRAPIVRLNLSMPAVGVNGQQVSADGPRACPVPATDEVVIGPLPGRTVSSMVGLSDALGRSFRVPARREGGPDRVRLDLTGLPNGTYVARLTDRNGAHAVRFVIAR